MPGLGEAGDCGGDAKQTCLTETDVVEAFAVSLAESSSALV